MRTLPPERFQYRSLTGTQARAIRATIQALGLRAARIASSGLGSGEPGRTFHAARGAGSPGSRVASEWQLDRLQAVVDQVEQIEVTALSGTDRAVTALARAFLLSDLGGDYPGRPGARARVEPLLRTRIWRRECAVLKGRVLLPLAELASVYCWDLGLGRVVRLPGGTSDVSHTLLAARLLLQHTRPELEGKAVATRPGVLMKRMSDRPILRAARSSLAEVARDHSGHMMDPFLEERPMVLVGPVYPAGFLGSNRLVQDRQGSQAILFGSDWAMGPGDCHALCYPSCLRGYLALRPVAVWERGIRGPTPFFVRARFSAPVDEPWRDPLLEDLEESLERALKGGLEGSGSARRELDSLGKSLVQAGFPDLARRVLRAAAGDGRSLVLSLHISRRIRRCPRRVEPARPDAGRWGLGANP